MLGWPSIFIQAFSDFIRPTNDMKLFITSCRTLYILIICKHILIKLIDNACNAPTEALIDDLLFLKYQWKSMYISIIHDINSQWGPFMDMNTYHTKYFRHYTVRLAYHIVYFLIIWRYMVIRNNLEIKRAIYISINNYR